MKTIFKYFLLLLSFLGFVGCHVYTTVNMNYDRSVDFKANKTFAWLADRGAVVIKDSLGNHYDNDIVRNNTKNYIIHCLGERGYRVEADSPDVLVQLILLNEKKERIITNSPSSYYSPYYYQNRYYFPYYYPYYEYYTFCGEGSYYSDSCIAPYKKTYVKGTIIINMFDRKLKKNIWTGSAEGDIYDPAYIAENIHPAVRNIMKKFPVKPLAKKKRERRNNNQNKYQNGDNILYPFLINFGK